MAIVKQRISSTRCESETLLRRFANSVQIREHQIQSSREAFTCRVAQKQKPIYCIHDKFTRFCQWKNLELNMQLTMNDFSVHRIIGRGGFGEVYGCRKADTGKMYAMKCLDKKRIKMKQGETLALNERIMLSLVSTG
ncbi:hypothetical protein ANCDUO_15980, partial [Ancylostoma duodenale]